MPILPGPYFAKLGVQEYNERRHPRRSLEDGGVLAESGFFLVRRYHLLGQLMEAYLIRGAGVEHVSARKLMH